MVLFALCTSIRPSIAPILKNPPGPTQASPLLRLPHRFTASVVPTLGDDLLTANAHVRLEAHLGAGPAPHILPEDDDLVEENAVEDTPYTPDTEAAFLALLDTIDSSTTDSPQSLRKMHYHAMSHLPLTYPWVSMVLDLKECCPSQSSLNRLFNSQ